MKIKRILAILLASVLLFSVFGCSKKSEGGDETEPVDITMDISSAPAVWSDTTTVSENMFVYYYNAYYRYYLETYSQSLSSLGLDPTKSLSSQQQSEKYTWQQYITIQVYSQLREMIALADGAKAEGITLSEEDLAEVDAQIKQLETVAKNAGYTSADYIEELYGKGVTADTVKAALSLRNLANKYYTILWDSYTYTEDECLEYYEAQRDSFVHFDCIKITVPAEDVPTLTACTDSESFTEAVRQIITKNNFVGDYERFADSIEEQVRKKKILRMDYDPNSSLGKWAVEDGRKGYDIHQKTESTGNVTVTMILPTSDSGAVNEVIYRDDVPQKNVMYMVFESSAGTSGVTKADSIYKNWQEDPTEERFSELSEEYDGGKAEGVVRGQFNSQVNEWVFSEERKPGDCAVIEADGGAYLLYMLEDGDPAWLAEVRTALKEAEYAEAVDAMIKKYPTEYNGDFIYNIVEVRAVSQTTVAP